MSDLDRLRYMILISLAGYLFALGIGYLRLRSLRYPFTRKQRIMWNYYVLWMTAIPILGPAMVAMDLWLMPARQAIVTTISLLVIWMVAAFFIVRQMCQPGGRLSAQKLSPAESQTEADRRNDDPMYQ